MENKEPKIETKRFKCPHCKGGQLEYRDGTSCVPVTFRTLRDVRQTVQVVHQWERRHANIGVRERGYGCVNCGMCFGKTLQDAKDLVNSRPQTKLRESPDLSIMTIRDLVAELKRRPNLTFSIIWMEENGRNDLSIEGRGNPTQVVGMLTRGTRLAIEWAEKGINYSTLDDCE